MQDGVWMPQPSLHWLASHLFSLKAGRVSN